MVAKLYITPNVFSLGTANKNHLQYLLKEGNTNVPNYGLLLAEVAGMPPPILKEAREIAEAFNSEVCQIIICTLREDLKLGCFSYVELFNP